MDPIPLDRYGIPEEILKLRPPTTAAQAAARYRADEALEISNPGQFVAYLDNWAGDELTRVVVAASADWDEYQSQLDHLTPDIRERVEITQVRDPSEPESIFGGALLFFTPEPEGE
jgi:hypothetical protein